MPDHKNILIVGFGLAGAAVAAHLDKKGVDFKVITSRHKPGSSHVAAGMFNPMVFRRLHKTWMADSILPYAKSFYTEMEHRLNTRFYYPLQYFKIFGKEEAEFWEKRSKSEETKPYLSENILPGLENEALKTAHGAAEVFGAGYLDVKVYLNAFGDGLLQQGRLEFDEVNYDDISLSDNKVMYSGEAFHKIVFCEGSHAVNNPWFGNLPFRLTKGEVLTVKSDLDMDYVVNKNAFVLPLGNHTYRIGATYEWKDLTNKPTEQGRNTLIEKFKAISDADFRIVAHLAGIRPTLANRRPVYEQHDAHPQLVVFNGLGTKGVMLSPYFANELVKKIRA